MFKHARLHKIYYFDTMWWSVYNKIYCLDITFINFNSFYLNKIKILFNLKFENNAN